MNGMCYIVMISVAGLSVVSGCARMHPLAHALECSTSDVASAAPSRQARLICRAIGESSDHIKAIALVSQLPGDIRDFVMLEVASVPVGYNGDSSQSGLDDKQYIISLKSGITTRVLILYRVDEYLGYFSNFQMPDFDDEAIDAEGLDLIRGLAKPVNGSAATRREYIAQAATLTEFYRLMLKTSHVSGPFMFFNSQDGSSAVIVSRVSGNKRYVDGGINCYIPPGSREDENASSHFSKEIDSLLKLWHRINLNDFN